MSDKIFWTTDDLIWMRVCRNLQMSWNDIARIFGIHTQTMIKQARNMKIFKKGEVIKGRGNWSRSA
jgi:predicted DNA-binding protein (UPF0251 family)